MLLARILAGRYQSVRVLKTRHINDALRNHNVEEIAEFISSSENVKVFYLQEPPVNEKFGCHVSDAVVRNSHIRRLMFYSDVHNNVEIRDLVAWIGSRNTLISMTSLEFVAVHVNHDMSVLDCSALFPLLLTSTSLHSLYIMFRESVGCTDDVMSALALYLGAASSLIKFEIYSHSLSEAAFSSLCNAVALSTVRQFTLSQYLFQGFNLETGAECLAWMIVESSLEEVWIRIWTHFEGEATWSESFISALKLTAPVRNMDFAFTQIGNDTTRLRINQKWKPFISANIPLALWPHILKKSHVSPETSHCSADIVFYFLRQKPDLVPAP